MTTKLPIELQQMYDRHSIGMVKIVGWLEELGIKIFHKTHILQNTQLDLHIRHDNDYVEMGPFTEDPYGELWHVYTAQLVDFDVPCDLLPKVMQAVKGHQSIGEKRIANNICIHTDVTNQFTMQKHIFADDYNWEKVNISLEFRVYHEWPYDGIQSVS